MVTGPCPNCGEQDVSTDNIYDCPHCDGVIHDSNTMSYGDSYQGMEGCASELRFYRAYKTVTREDEYGRTETEREHITGKGFMKCPHCGNWSIYKVHSLKPIQSSPKQYMFDNYSGDIELTNKDT